jgi:alkyl hydroperoxide reductase subunit AhpF
MRDAPTHPGPAEGHGLRRPIPRTLEVYVSRHCPNCGDALRLAEEAATRFPSVVVRVIDLERDAASPPEGVVAVPTYVFEGRVVALGNPEHEELFARLRRGSG